MTLGIREILALGNRDARDKFRKPGCNIHSGKLLYLSDPTGQAFICKVEEGRGDLRHRE
jgi:hypothetical protein